MAENKTKPTDESVEAYIASRANEQQRADCAALMTMMEKATKAQPRMWGPSIVGYGEFRYTYASGRSGLAPLAAFAIRGRELVVYLAPYWEEAQALLAELGPHRMTKGCLYIKRLGDVKQKILKQLITGSIAEERRRYGHTG